MSENKSGPAAVREARQADVARISDIQAASMVETVVTIAGEKHRPSIQEQLKPELIAQTWSETIAADPALGRGVLVAWDEEGVRGFAAYVTPDKKHSIAAGLDNSSLPFEVPVGSTQILALEVEDQARRCGHGSRLLAAVADSAREESSPGLLVWIVGEDEERVQFFEKAGFAPVGVKRSLDTGAGVMTEHLWFAAL